MKICHATFGTLLWLLAAPVGRTQVSLQDLSVSAPEQDNTVEAELHSFTPADNYEINLYADESDGVVNPVCMIWDPAGRLWVLCTSAYPQLKPGEPADDQLLILEDTDGDGRADSTTIFADRLNMPTGFALGNGGAWIGQGTDLLHLKDSDGDDKADIRQVVLSGFGTGDTHQNINSFAWSPGGELYFCQGLHSFSRVETPWGVSRLDEHGTWRLRPRRLQLHSFRRTSGGGNPWGIIFGHWGEPFIKSNNMDVAELLPALVSTDRLPSFWGGEMSIGGTRVKSMIIEFADSPHLPDDIQGDMLIAGYFARDVNRLSVERDGSGHRLTRQPDLLKSSHNAFRPVDIRIGPDGAIYIADWYNPIIGHYQASFRHPDRDRVHGRIWRVTAMNRPLVQAPNPAQMDAPELCEQLTSDWRYVRMQAKQRLADLPSAEVIPAISRWVAGLNEDTPNLEHHLYEAIAVYETHETVNESLLRRLLRAEDDRARAYATRVVGRWHDRIDGAFDLLADQVADASARVRLEAIVACSDIHVPQAMTVAARAASRPMDRFHKHALTQTVHALAEHWRPALRRGELQFESPAELVYVLKAFGGDDIAADVRSLVKSRQLTIDTRRELLKLLAGVGTGEDLLLVFFRAVHDPKLLTALPGIAMQNRVTPLIAIHNHLASLMESEDADVQEAATRLAGLWQQKALTDRLLLMLDSPHISDRTRAAAILSLADLDTDSETHRFRSFISARHDLTVSTAALEAVGRFDIDAAAVAGLELLRESADADTVGPVLSTLMRRRGAGRALAEALPDAGLTADHTKLISRWLSAAGIDDVPLVRALTKAMGIQPGTSPKYQAHYVRRLADEVRTSGDAAAGKLVFLSSLTNCTGCHSVRDVSSTTEAVPRGPDLSAVAAGLQLELIIESVVWPKRQIKEGYELTTVLTDEGQVFSGYLTSDNGNTVHLRELSTGRMQKIPSDSIEERVAGGTAMPVAFTNTLTRKELCDLIAWLATLKSSDGRH